MRWRESLVLYKSFSTLWAITLRKSYSWMREEHCQSTFSCDRYIKTTLFSLLILSQSFLSSCFFVEGPSGEGGGIVATPIHRKKRFPSFPSLAGMSITKLPLGRNNAFVQGGFSRFYNTLFNTASSAASQIPLWRRKGMGSNPGQLRLRHWLSDALITGIELIHHLAWSHSF
jgi:hypothetical protein